MAKRRGAASGKPTGAGSAGKRKERRASKFGGGSSTPKVKDAGVKKKKSSSVQGKSSGQYQRAGKTDVVEKTGGKTEEKAESKPVKRKSDNEQDKTSQLSKHHKPNSDLIQSLSAEWEKLRPEKVAEGDRKKGLSQLANKVKGKVVDLGSNHKTSRVIQAIIKNGTAAEKAAIFKEITNTESMVLLAKSAYGNFIVRSLLEKSPKKELPRILACLRGRVVPLARHPCGTAVLEAAYSVANSAQRSALIAEFYGPEFALKAQAAIVAGGPSLRLRDALADPGLGGRRAVIGHASRVLAGVWEKGMVASAYIHRVLNEYFQEAPASMVQEAVEALAGDAVLVRMMHTLDGARAVNTLMAAASAKQRKKVLKSLKDLVLKIALDQSGRLVILGLMDVVDDTVLMKKIVISELCSDLYGLASDKHARVCLLHLLNPRCPRYLPPALVETLPPLDQLQVADSSTAGESQKDKEEKSKAEKGKQGKKGEKSKGDEDDGDGVEEEGASGGGPKKPLTVKRRELLSGKDGLGKKLVDMCFEHSAEMLCDHVKADVLAEVMSGGVECEMAEAVGCEEMQRLYEAVAEAATVRVPKTKECEGEEEEEEKEGTSILTDYTGSRVLRRLALLPAPKSPEGVACFASVLWAKVFKGNCSKWLNTHAEKVLAAILESEDEKTAKAIRVEITKLLKPVSIVEW
eukprot:CAMPEP_0196594540 /NCGR_PEP_ID=MMETSP1081-20130531/78637_1 /TAXON_ID=36882 /ORGANISM="Pyramimonas amylifera, Strain CCMP720" /LENGTH=687 /DNA_ID=CAMNT_0041918831 /DNA_START=92 /DNA_END=2152 /DNA_ORIENTATION=+